MKKAYQRPRYRRKTPKVGRKYRKNIEESKTFDKSNDINDLVEELYINKSDYEVNEMSKNIEKEIEEMANQMAKSTQDPKELLKATIRDLGPEGLRKSIPDLSDSQKNLVLEVLEEMNKGRNAVSMDANYDGDRKFITHDQMGTEVEDGSDDEDEKLVLPEANEHSHQGDLSPEGRDEHVIKGKDVESKEKACKAESCDMDSKGKEVLMKEEKAEKDSKKEEGKEKAKKAGVYKSLEDIRALKDEVIKAYEDANLPYTDELVKGEMKKRMECCKNPEESQVEMGGQDKGGKPDRADKPKVKDIEVAKDASETADEVKVPKMKKSIQYGDPLASLRANSLGRNHHFSINNYYNDVLNKSKESEKEANETLEKSEKLKKSERDDVKDDINDIIAKGYDQTFCDLAEEEIQKSQIMGEFSPGSFSDEDMAEALNMSKSDYEKFMGIEKGIADWAGKKVKNMAGKAKEKIQKEVKGKKPKIPKRTGCGVRG